MLATEAYKGPPLEGQVSFRLVVYRLPPQSWSKTKIALALAGRLRPTTKPDLTNTIKGIEDALKGLTWRDDAQIVHIELDKFYSDEPRAEVEIDEISA
jgi:Holliday junction resolvase RusA-like endonuclease